jgi:hypothetical protein
MMNDSKIEPIPPLKAPNEADLARHAATRILYFNDNRFPDEKALEMLFETLSPSMHAEILDTLPYLLPLGLLTSAIAKMLSDTIMGLYYRFKGTKQRALGPVELATFIKKMPCQKAGEAFLHVYNHWFREMVGHRNMRKTKQSIR